MPLAELQEMYRTYKDKIPLEFIEGDEYSCFVAIDDGAGVVSITIAAEHGDAKARDFVDHIAEQRRPKYDITVRFV